MRIADGLMNAMSGLGLWRDKSMHSAYTNEWLDRYELLSAYQNAWLPKKIVDLPADDSTRKWRAWNGDATQVDKIETLERRLDLQNKVRQAMIRARLYGGAAIYIGTNRTALEKELSEDEELRHLTVLDTQDIGASEYERDTTAEGFGRPKYYRLRRGRSNVNIHPSRLMLFYGHDALDNHSEWGKSVLQAPWQAIQNADSTAANIASLVFEAKIDVYKIPNLMQQCGDESFVNTLYQRLSAANAGKSNHNALVMDSDEGYEQKQMNFASLEELMMSQYKIAAGASGIPITRLINESASGLNNNGDAETRDYYDNIQSVQNLSISPAMRRFDRCLIRNALGNNPDNVDYEWCSLWQLDEKQQAEIAEKNASTIKALTESEILPTEALQQSAVEIMESTGAMPGLKTAVDEFYEDDV